MVSGAQSALKAYTMLLGRMTMLFEEAMVRAASDVYTQVCAQQASATARQAETHQEVEHFSFDGAGQPELGCIDDHVL